MNARPDDANEKNAEAALLRLIGLQIDTQSQDNKIEIKNEAYAQILNDFEKQTDSDEYNLSTTGSERAVLAMKVLIYAEQILVHEDDPRLVTPYDITNIQAAIKYTKALIQDHFGNVINPENNKVVVQMENVLRDLRFEIVQGVVLSEPDKESMRSNLDNMLEYIKQRKQGFTDEDKAYFWAKIRDSLTYKSQNDDLLAVVVNHKIFKSSDDSKLFSKPGITFQNMRTEMDEMMSAQKAAKKDKAVSASKKH
jgi:hypothetical protein